MKKIIVTTSWDDGHKLDVKLAELLKKYSINGTFYVTPKNHEFAARELLTPDEVVSLSSDFEIGAHTITHVNLSKVGLDVAINEISESRTYLSKLLARDVTSFCYPYGAYNSDVKRIVKNCGFLLARTVDRFNTEIDDPYELKTTAQVLSHPRDAADLKLISKYKTVAWEKLAKAQFDEVLRKGGVFHLWGHSWEIEKHKNWEKLEELLKYISGRKNISYLTNSQLI
ncbi:MAG TPA: polysaccharide deacetylase family protein [Patescibacteria group bacterium]|nr:polysaccharide deacetylase family protein [Patescibacteria group bacterium]